MTILANGARVSDLDCVRAYFASKGDAELFDLIIYAHRGPVWFEDGLRLNCPLSLMHAIAKNIEHLTGRTSVRIVRES